MDTNNRFTRQKTFRWGRMKPAYLVKLTEEYTAFCCKSEKNCDCDLTKAENTDEKKEK